MTITKVGPFVDGVGSFGTVSDIRDLSAEKDVKSTRRPIMDIVGSDRSLSGLTRNDRSLRHQKDMHVLVDIEK